MTELSHESVFIAVKDALQRNGIKLWEAPYYLESSGNETEMMVSILRGILRFLLIASLFSSSGFSK